MLDRKNTAPHAPIRRQKAIGGVQGPGCVVIGWRVCVFLACVRTWVRGYASEA